MNKTIFNAIREKNQRNEEFILSPNACFSRQGIRRKPDSDDSDVRSIFSHDTDRIIHSMAYTRYIDKTQVFYLVDHDHITHRVLHVQLVSKIAREIGRELSLNVDLIEAIALGHDIGHPPFGHEGEAYLSAISQEHGIGEFHHNVQSVRFLQYIEKNGEGLNLALQTLDGILCHNGELLKPLLKPHSKKKWEDLDREMQAGSKSIVPMTLEGCVVRYSDIFGYIGRDIEDAIKLGLIQRTDIPEDITRLLGNTNRDIINTLVLDIVESSYEKDYIALSPEIGQALFQLKDFNYRNIYLNPRIKTESHKIERIYRELFQTFLNDIYKENPLSKIYTDFLSFKKEEYIHSNPPPVVVRDFISGMTDDYILKTYADLFIPEKIRLHNLQRNII